MKFLNKEWKGKCHKLYALRDKNSLWIHFQGQTWLWKSPPPLSKRQKQPRKSQGLIQADLPGKIQKVFVKAGDTVKKGQSLLILSAMKIEYSFKAERAGRVEEIFCRAGQFVDSGKKLMRVKY